MSIILHTINSNAIFTFGSKKNSGDEVD